MGASDRTGGRVGTGTTTPEVGAAVANPLENPVVNSPHDPPARHFELGPDGTPTGVVLDGRRRSESFVPVPPSRKRARQAGFDLDVTGERREVNELINDVRYQVDRWRARGHPGVTPYTRKLLEHWAAGPPERDEPVFFCQREAAETAVFLAEVTGRHGWADFRPRLHAANAEHNDGLPRLALKMATGTGKTVVMAMLIAWQTVNKVANPRDARFARQFLVVTPGITIRDRLRVLRPTDPGNYYRERDLVPPDLWHHLLEARIVITNYHAFLPRDAKEIRGVAATTRRILTAGKRTDPFRESPEQIVARVLRDLDPRGGIVVLDDEAHHCYRDKPLADPADAGTGDERKEADERNEAARVWFKGLLQVGRAVGLKCVYDLSATPYYLRGSGYLEGFIFPWTVSDFSLMDAIESGIVKVPRIPVDDDAAGDVVSYLRLWDHVGKELPKRRTKKLDEAADWSPPVVLEGALESLYRSYEKRYRRWEAELAPLGEPPPVLIVVCPNTLVSRLVYEWISGRDAEAPDGTTTARPGRLALLSNVEGGRFVPRPRTILIDSARLESGDVMGRDFKTAARHEIDTFKDEYRRRHPGADVDALTDEDLLREVMNTVGKKGKLGEHVRCVVSVAMLTEGWDANTVTHVLGIRRFGSQLLCEQVVGRGLRRRSYALNDDGLLDPEYAEVYGVPFSFIPGTPGKEAPPRPPAVEVYAVPGREALAITFPHVDGYRVEIPDSPPYAVFDDDCRLHVSPSTVATRTVTAPVVGETEEQTLERVRSARPQEVAYAVARQVVHRHLTGHDGAPRPWIFPPIVEIARRWVAECVTVEPGSRLGLLLLSENTEQAAEALVRAVHWVDHPGEPLLRPVLRPFDAVGSTEGVAFFTRQATIDTVKSHVNRVVLDGPGGNTWEQILAMACEADARVAAYVKNDHLGFSIPYVHQGAAFRYHPDFLVRLAPRDDTSPVRTLVVEVSGGAKRVHSPGSVAEKAYTARYRWCAAVNHHGGFGRWGFVEITDMPTAAACLGDAIESLYADGGVTGLRDAPDPLADPAGGPAGEEAV